MLQSTCIQGIKIRVAVHATELPTEHFHVQVKGGRTAFPSRMTIAFPIRLLE